MNCPEDLVFIAALRILDRSQSSLLSPQGPSAFRFSATGRRSIIFYQVLNLDSNADFSSFKFEYLEANWRWEVRRSKTMESPSFSTPAEIYQEMQANGGNIWTGRSRVFLLPCDCHHCEQQYHSHKDQQSELPYMYSGGISRDETIDLSRQYCTDIFEDLQRLRSMLVLHGDRIYTRWVNKSNAKRRKYLKDLRNELHEGENAWLDTYNHCDGEMGRQKHRNTFLLPYMTIETFSKHPSRLLRLVYNRVSHVPEKWVPFDNRQLLAGWSAGAFEEKFNAGCISLHGSSYGKWSPFDAKTVHNGESYGAPRALLILEAQSTLIRFLCDFVTSILKDLDQISPDRLSPQPTRDSKPPCPPRPPQLEEPPGMKFGMTYYNEPFSFPPIFNRRTIDQLIEIVSEKQAETQDSLWLLQTDPGYFHDFASYSKEYNLGTINGAEMNQDARARALTGRVICYPIAQVQEWNCLAEELHHVRQEYEAHKDMIKAGQPLPEAYDRALGSLLFVIQSRLKAKANHLKELAFTSPAWKGMWQIHECLNKDDTLLKRKDGRIIDFREIYKTDHILYCLLALGEKPGSAKYIDIALILKSLDLHLANCGKLEAAKLNSMTYSRITDMAAMYRIQAAVQMHRPAQSPLYTSSTEASKTRNSAFWRIASQDYKIIKLFDDPRQFRFQGALNDLDKYRMPKGVKNRQWQIACDAAYEALSDVWSLARESFKKMHRAMRVDEADTEETIRLLSYHDSPEHLAMLGRQREEILEYISRSAIRNNRATTISMLPYQPSVPHIPTSCDLPKKGAKITAQARSKPKPRQADRPYESIQNIGDVPESNCPVNLAPVYYPPTLPKKVKSLDTLRLLFPNASSDLKGTIQWSDFIATLQELGFSGEHRGGSEWTFRYFNSCRPSITDPISEDIVEGKQSILVHQPHPVTKMSSVRLQWIGKRLWRRFGWTRECFQGL